MVNHGDGVDASTRESVSVEGGCTSIRDSLFCIIVYERQSSATSLLYIT
jgi:hypothetical protein